MRQKFAAGCALAMALFLASPAVSAQSGDKYGFVNIAQVIAQSDEGQVEAAKLESLGAEKEQELNAQRQELEELAKEYEESVSSGQPDAKLRNRIDRMKRELERDLRQAQSDVDTSRQDRIQAIGQKVVKVIRQFGQDNGYAAIFRVDSGQVVYVDSAVDITDQVLAAYNKAYPAE